MMRLVLCRSKELAAPLALALALAVPSTGWAATACIDGRQSAFLTNNPTLPCTFGAGDPTDRSDPLHASDPLQVPQIPAIVTPFNGEHTSILFLTDSDPLGPGVQNSSGLDCGPGHTAGNCMPESASDVPAGTKVVNVTPTVSTVSGNAEIKGVTVTIIDPMVFGTGTLSWSASVNPDNTGTTTSDTFDQTQTSTFFDLSASPAKSVAVGFQFTIGCGGTCTAQVDDASVFGIKANFMLAPEPSSLAAQGAALGVLAALARRRQGVRVGRA
jgi:hypothetical protein